MRRRVYSVVAGSGASIAPAAEMVRCARCGVAMTPPIPHMQARPDNIVTYQGRCICVRCGVTAGVVVRGVADDD